MSKRASAIRMKVVNIAASEFRRVSDNRIKVRFGVAVLALVVLAATPGFSGTIAYDQAVQITGNQVWFGSLGMDFEVNSAIVVTDIGVFSNNAFGHLLSSPTTDLNAAIFALGAGGFSATSGTINTATAVSFAVGPSYTVVNNWLFQSIAPVVLLPGFYTIVAQGYNSASNPNGNLGVGPLPPSFENTGGALITFGGTSRYQNLATGITVPNPVIFPSTLDSGPPNRYFAGDFQFAALATPEPASLTLLGGGLLGLCLLMRRRRA